MAGDTTLLLANIASLSTSINILNKFGACSGLKLNLQKTEIIPIGKAQSKHINLPDHLKLIKVNNGPF